MRAFAGTVLARTQAVTGNVGTVVVTGLTNGTAYTFDVAAVNASGYGRVLGPDGSGDTTDGIRGSHRDGTDTRHPVPAP